MKKIYTKKDLEKKIKNLKKNKKKNSTMPWCL